MALILLTKSTREKVAMIVKNYHEQTLNCTRKEPIYFNPFIFATRWRRPLIFQIMNHALINSQSLKYQRFQPSGCKDIGFRKFGCLAKT